LPPELRTKEGALRILKKLVEKSGYRLRKEGYYASGVAISIKFIDKGGFHQSKKFIDFCDNDSFWQNTSTLLKNCSWKSRPIWVSVSAFNLSKPLGRQVSILTNIERSRAISEILDKVNDQFGAETLFPASLFETRNSAPDRIPFGKPRYDIIH
jgi:hypothetical protein